LFISIKPVPFYAIIWQSINYAFLVLSLINMCVHIISYYEMMNIYVEASKDGVLAFGIVAIIDGVSYEYRH